MGKRFWIHAVVFVAFWGFGWWLFANGMSHRDLTMFGPVYVVPSPRPAPVVFSEAMDSLSSKGTALLFCIDNRIQIVCGEMGGDSAECAVIRMANYRSMFEYIRDTNRCMDSFPQGASGAVMESWEKSCGYVSGLTADEVRSLHVDRVKQMQHQCSEMETDAELQAIIDEAKARRRMRGESGE